MALCNVLMQEYIAHCMKVIDLTLNLLALTTVGARINP